MKRAFFSLITLAILGIFAGLGGCAATEPSAAQQSMFQAGNSLQTLYIIRDAKTKRSSSSDLNWKDGNGDARPIKKGETLELANLNGPGIIRHIWFTPFGGGPKFPRALVLRMYWDDNTEPSVEAPLGDFFAVGHGAQRMVNSLPVTITSEQRAYNCYWPMPFAKKARITMSNDGPEDAGLYWYIDYEEVPKLPAGTAYFHAQYRQEYPCVMGQDYLILDTEGAGHYVGTVQSAQFRTASWYGEGDDRFFIDGEAEPSLRGTGTEDYFCDAWGFRLFDRPFYGVTLLDGYEVGDRVTVYRWHISDPVHFKKSLKVTIEHKGVTFDTNGKLVSGFMERQDLMSSVAYWYQTGKAKRFASIPPYSERLTPETRIEFETMLEVAKAKVEPTSAKIDTQAIAFASGGNHLFAQFASQKSVLTIPFTLKEKLQGIARLQLIKSWDYGVYKITLDGKPMPNLDSIDLYNAAVVQHVANLGYLDLAAGEHVLKVECLGKNDASKGFFVGVDALIVEHITPYLVPPAK